ncbi:unnamed protein product [Urochloa decumbens]|uniref:Uncharacterized protein n=1 Tax=Urochloa decumbens TaxID=240449 RepID=A0ABC9BUG4_9POAL
MLVDGERNLNYHGTVQEPTAVMRCLRCHCCLICSVLDCHHSRRLVLQCAPRRLYSSSQGNATVQQNPYFEQRHSAYEVPESCNVQGVYRQQIGQQFVEPVPMSIGTNVAGRNHEGSLDGKLMLTQSPMISALANIEPNFICFGTCWPSQIASTDDLGRSNMFIGAHGLQQQRDMSNWRHSSLQMGPRTRLNLSSERSQTPAVTGAPSGGQHRNMFSWRNELLPTPHRANLNMSGAPVSKGAPLGGPQRHRNMFNSSQLSVELLRQTQLSCYFKGRASLTTGSTTGLEHHGIGNMCSSRSNSSLQTSPWETELNISSGSRIMDDTTNYVVNERKRRSLLTSMGASPYNAVQPEDARMLIKEDIRPAKRPYSLWAPENYSVGSWNRNMSELGSNSNHCAFNNTATQNFEQINSATVLEKISHDLLDDADIEPTGAAEETTVMSTINSLSNLLQQDRAPATARSSEASYAGGTAAIATPLNISTEAATNQVLGMAPDAESSGGSCSRAGGVSSSNSMSPPPAIVEGLSCEEEEQMGEIEMDPAYLSELLPFCP